MTAATLTLTDFLLARIAEDEADAGRLGYDRRVAEMGGFPFSVDHPLRMLAECEAKRRIVEAAWNLESFDFAEDGSYGHIVGKQREILCALAAVYADHPDHRDEWRP